MAMLSRYKKPGGFIQLLNLIETCGPTKQERFLKVIEEESKHWAAAIRKKMLTVDRIMGWDDNTVGEIAIRLPHIALGTAMHGFDDEQKAKLLATMTHSQKRHIDDISDDKKPSENEISTTFVRILEEARVMIAEGYIRIEKVDPDMVIEDDIEESLEKIQDGFDLDGDTDSDEGDEDTFPVTAIEEPGSTVDFSKVKQRLFQLNRENQKLKKENENLKGKLAQIKKIA